jgi:hypothetical protein
MSMRTIFSASTPDAVHQAGQQRPALLTCSPARFRTKVCSQLVSYDCHSRHRAITDGTTALRSSIDPGRLRITFGQAAIQ